MQRSSIAIACIFLATTAIAQIKTEGTKTEVDSASGKTTTTTYVEVKKVEDITPRTNMIVVNPLKFFLFYNLSYFHAVSPTLAVGGGAQLPTLKDVNGFGVNAEVRFYPSKKALRGFYVAPNISYNHLTSPDYDWEGTTTKSSADAFTVGALLGWQWFPGDDFAIGLGIGYDYYFLSESDHYIGFGDYDGGAPALRFDIGYAWD